MKKIIVSVCLSMFIISKGQGVYAMDKRISASKHYVTESKITATEAKKYSAWKAGYYKGKANGYITSTKKHYANVALYVQYNSYLKYSGRKWGIGKVSVGTGWGTGVSTLPVDLYYSAIYYGF